MKEHEFILMKIKLCEQRNSRRGIPEKPVTHRDVWSGSGSYDVIGCDQDLIDSVEIPKAR